MYLYATGMFSSEEEYTEFLAAVNLEKLLPIIKEKHL